MENQQAVSRSYALSLGIHHKILNGESADQPMHHWATDCIAATSIVQADDYPFKPDIKELAEFIERQRYELYILKMEAWGFDEGEANDYYHGIPIND